MFDGVYYVQPQRIKNVETEVHIINPYKPLYLKPINVSLWKFNDL